MQTRKNLLSLLLLAPLAALAAEPILTASTETHSPDERIPAEEIVESGSLYRVIVVTDEGRSRLERVLRGSTATEVVRKAVNPPWRPTASMLERNPDGSPAA